MRGSEFARGDARHQPWQHCGDQQERRAQRQRVVAAHRDAEPREPCREPRQVRIRPCQVLAFLPVEGLVDEQRQARGDHQLDEQSAPPIAPMNQRRARTSFRILSCLVTLDPMAFEGSAGGVSITRPAPSGRILSRVYRPGCACADSAAILRGPHVRNARGRQHANRRPARALLKRALAQVNTLVLGKPQEVRLAFVALLSDGHLLIEDLPGLGKTTLAHALAATLGLGFQRVQFTSDLLPSDIVGVSVFDAQARRFEFHPGPIFAHVLLADEINRAPPRTQSALLEAMAEHQVTVDGNTHRAARPVLRHRDAESGRPRRHVSAARFATRPLPVAPHARLSRRGRRTRAAGRHRSPRPDRAGQPLLGAGDVLALRRAVPTSMPAKR